MYRNMRIYMYHSILLAMNWHHDEVWHELWPVIKHQRVYILGRKAHSQTRHWCPGNSQGSADWLGNDDGILPKKNANLEYHKDPRSLVAELVAIAYSSIIAAGCSYCFWTVPTCGHFPAREWNVGSFEGTWSPEIAFILLKQPHPLEGSKDKRNRTWISQVDCSRIW